MKYYAQQINEDKKRTQQMEQDKQQQPVPFRETMEQREEDKQKTDEIEHGKHGPGAL